MNRKTYSIFLLAISLFFSIITKAQSSNFIIQKSPNISYQELEKLGLKTRTKAGNIATVYAQLSDLKSLKSKGLILSFEGSQVKVPKRKLDSISLAESRVSPLFSNPQSYNIPNLNMGKDVIVGIIDIGFQLDHPTFYDSSGSRFRIKYFWDQISNGNYPMGFDYGNEMWLENDMKTFVDAFENHGTHVAGLAAGSGYGVAGRPFRGVASEADIIAVNILYFNDTLNPSPMSDYVVSNAAIIDAMAYIFDKAAIESKPAVINLSWGMHTGPHDGTSLFDQAVEQLVGPGRIFVGACGNEGLNKMHILSNPGSDTSFSIAISRVPRQFVTYESNHIDIWGSANSEFEAGFCIIDSLGNIINCTDFYSTQTDAHIKGTHYFHNDSLEYEFFIENSFSGNNKPNILAIGINHKPNDYFTVLALKGNSDIHAWNSGQHDSWSGGSFYNKLFNGINNPKFVDGDNNFTVGENGGTGKRTISVGVYTDRDFTPGILGPVAVNMTKGSIAEWSSQGTTVDGRVKPDIISPGVAVISAYNRHAYRPWNFSSLAAMSISGTDTNYYGQMSGTSMAAPHVAGIVALMLELRPDASPEQIKSALIAGAIEDGFTGPVPNSSAGNGKVDAINAIQALLGVTAKQNLPENIYISIFPNPARNEIRVKSTERSFNFNQIEILDISGKSIKTINLDQNISDYSVETYELKSGTYFIKIKSGDTENTLKFIKI